MPRFLSILTLVLMVFLFPPTALALLSNDAVPGDATYSIKRKLEGGILFVMSLNPTTRAWFSVERTQRRFKEVEALLNKDSSRSIDALDELVNQTSQAADEVTQIEDEAKRAELIQDLREAISEYDQGLEQASQEAEKKALNQRLLPVQLPTL